MLRELLLFRRQLRVCGDESHKSWNSVFLVGSRVESGVCEIHVGTFETSAVKTSYVD